MIKENKYNIWRKKERAKKGWMMLIVRHYMITENTIIGEDKAAMFLLQERNKTK